jgi:hypothetical protein
MALLEGVSREGDTIILSRVNLQIVNGTGSTDGETNGLGNLIVGYNEPQGTEYPGSHNIVVGKGHNYSSYGGLVGGIGNTISAPFATVSGGYSNTASGSFASVSGGVDNEASGSGASVGGGYENTADGDFATVSGGYANRASWSLATISGERPAYDSGWRSISKGEYLTLLHGLGGDPDNYIVDLQFYDKDSNNGRHHVFYGGAREHQLGGFWKELTDQEITIHRYRKDSSVDRVRVRIWINN